MPGILVVAEQRNGTLKKTSFEAATVGVALGKKSGKPVAAVVVGKNVQGIAAELGQYGVGTVYAVEAPELELYSTEGYGRAVKAAVEAAGADCVLLPCTSFGKDLGPYLSAKLDAPLAADVTAVDWEGRLVARRPVYAGKAIVTLDFPGAACVLLSLRPNNFEAHKQPVTAAVKSLPAPAGEIRARVKEVVVAAGNKRDLTESEVIVSGGRGLKDPANFHWVEKLAAALDGTVGASRAVVDAGWRPHSEQVGQTGKVVTPNLYIACGISGAVQHLAGMSGSKVIVAINKDKDAPIFQVANYGIVGDTLEVLPVLIEAVKQLKGNS